MVVIVIEIEIVVADSGRWFTLVAIVYMTMEGVEYLFFTYTGISLFGSNPLVTHSLGKTHLKWSILVLICISF